MHIDKLTVLNFRGLREITLSLGDFSCVIGENNAGKSSLLQALHRFCDGKKLAETDFYDKLQEVAISAEIVSISDRDLEVLAEEHRERIRELQSSGSLKLVRRFSTDGSGSLRAIVKAPRDSRLKPANVDSFTKGKSGTILVNQARLEYPEVANNIPDKITQTALKQLVADHCRTLPPEELEEVESDLPTGIPNSVLKLLPTPVYIPAVKDLADDIKTTDSATFGKLLSLLLNAISPRLGEDKELFSKLARKLNRLTSADGTVVDERLEEIKHAELCVERNLRENFPQARVEIKIPPPDLDTILSGARIDVDDGAMVGPVETKGDGLKRSVVFSIFRAFLDLSSQPGWQGSASSVRTTPHYLFLFEEPELFLHPSAQKILFDALAFVSREHQVVVTTHSPLFFSADATKTFVKMSKRMSGRPEEKPYSQAVAVSFDCDLPAKESFQLISYENSNVAFFASEVVLVEGSSDLIALKHIAKTLNPIWDLDGGKIAVVRVLGKGNFRRFTDFFERFNIRVHILTDLDILTRDFDKLGLAVGHPIHQHRSNLLEAAEPHARPDAPARDRLRELFGRLTFREQWSQCIAILRAAKEGTHPSEDDVAKLNLILDEELRGPILHALKSEPTLVAPKRELLALLRAERIYVLERGSIETYYPPSVVGGDKVARAEDFVKQAVTREEICALCDNIPQPKLQGTLSEFEVICSSLFSTMRPSTAL